MEGVKKYFSDLIDVVGRSWNHFWFTPANPYPLAVLRVLVGLACLYFLLSQSADLVRWFGPRGLLSPEVVQTVEDASQPSQMPLMRWSYLNLITSPTVLWSVHILGILMLLAFTLGFATRITSILSLIVVLAYVHRAPFLMGQFEPVLTMILLYLCIGPSGFYLSIDRLLQKRKRSAAQESLRRSHTEEPEQFLSAAIAIRLMQVHLSLFYLFMGLAKLGGGAWWNGTAVWWLIAQTESRLIDISGLYNSPYLVNVWTHLIVLFELSFALLVWNRWARPLLLAIAIPMWLSLAIVTGLVSFSCVMLVANLVFVPADSLRAATDGILGKLGVSTANSETSAAAAQV